MVERELAYEIEWMAMMMIHFCSTICRDLEGYYTVYVAILSGGEECHVRYC